MRWAQTVVWLLVACMLTACGARPKPLPPRVEEARSYAARGAAAFEEGCMSKAEELFRASLELHRSLDHQDGVARDLNSLAVLRAAQSNFPEALALLDTAEAINRKTGNHDALYANRLNRVRIYMKAGDWDKAREALDNAREAAEAAERGMASWYLMEGLWFTGRGNIEQAMTSLEQALGRVRPSEDPRTAAAVHQSYARALLKSGRPGEALNQARQSLDLDKEAQYARGIAEDLAVLGDAAAALGESETAADFMERAFYVYFYLGDRKQVKRLAAYFESAKDQTRLERLTPYIKRAETEGFQAFCR